jgi:hypothetical protein
VPFRGECEGSLRRLFAPSFLCKRRKELEVSRIRTSLTWALAWLTLTIPATGAPAQPRGGGAEASAAEVRRAIQRANDLTELVTVEQVRKELSLNEEQAAKLKEVSDRLRAEMREQFGRLAAISDRDQRLAKTADWAEEFGEKVRKQLREVLAREQLVRLYQIRLQLRGALEGLTTEFVAGRLKLGDQTNQKLHAIQEEVDGKVQALLRALADLSPEKRGGKMREVFAQSRKLRADADEQALKLLTDEQREAFEKMQGKKFDLDRSELYPRSR